MKLARDPRSHIQAVGRDEAGRLQYKYHEKWTETGHEVKRERLAQLGGAVAKVSHDLRNILTSAQLFADFAGLGLATVHRVLERRQPSPVGPLTPALVAEQQKVADAFAQLGLIPKPIRVADIVWLPGQALASAR